MKIAALLSGGVDSSVALSLLRSEGHDVTAFYLKVWLEDELSHLGTCPWEEDLRFAKEVCRRLDVPLEVRSLQKPYWDRVVRYAVSELEAGRTPSPDVLCNQQIKFGAFLDEIDSGFDRVASGHYARRDDVGGSVVLKSGVDPVKDQTYFLSRLSQQQLARALFPLGGIHKSDVRKRARELGLSNQDRRDSQGICFLGKIPYREFVRHHLGEREGDIVDVESGSVLGRHKGYWFHTIGQREGLGLSHGPWFVQGKDVARNVVYGVPWGSPRPEVAASRSRSKRSIGSGIRRHAESSWSECAMAAPFTRRLSIWKATADECSSWEKIPASLPGSSRCSTTETSVSGSASIAA